MARFYVSIGGYMQVTLALQKKTWLNVVQPITVRQDLFVYSYICNDDDGDDDEMRMVCFDCTPQGITAPTINSTDYANIYNLKNTTMTICNKCHWSIYLKYRQLTDKSNVYFQIITI